MKKILMVSIAAIAALAAEAKHPGVRRNPDGKEFQRLQFNNPDAVVPMHHSVFGLFFCGDWDHDGKTDIWMGAWPFEGHDWYWAGFKLYLSSKGRTRADGTFVYGRGEWTNELPEPRERGKWEGCWPDAKGFNPNSIHKTPPGCGYGSADYSFCTDDLDGDGLNDKLVFANDRLAYGWHDKYNEKGVWLNPHHCFVYVLWGRKPTKDNPCTFNDPEPFYNANGQPMMCVGHVQSPILFDFDGDGDLDLLTREAPDLFLYRENIGTKTAPKFALPRDLVGPDGERLSTHLCFSMVSLYDYDGDGVKDLMVLDEESSMCWFRGRGMKNGLPVFEHCRFLLQEADEVYYGDMATPFAVDIDGDGDEDIVTGNAAGDLAIIENLSKKGVEFPKWSAPKPVTTPDGKPFNIRAGVNGSIQGPQEAKYGYTITTAADWDGDGKIDILMNTIWGKILWLRNIGTKTAPKFDYPKGIEVEWGGPGSVPAAQPELKWGWFKPKTQKNPKEIITQWRTTPWPVDLNGDGLVDLVLCDVDGDLAYWERYRDEKGVLRLKPPRKALVDMKGKPIRASRELIDTEWLKGWAGASGRRKVAMADWDGDGKLDLIMNYGINCRLYLQRKAVDGKWFFEAQQGTMSKEALCSHDPVPGICDFNADGKPDLLLGPMDGHIYYLRNPNSTVAGNQPAAKPLPERGICAHQGGVHDPYPGNSLQSISNAVACGVQMIEMDVAECRTGEFVLTHDGNVDKEVCGGFKGSVGKYTLAELQKMERSRRLPGVHYADFDDALKIIPREGVWINIDVRGRGRRYLTKLITYLSERGRLHQAFLTTTHEDLVLARKIEPKVLLNNIGRTGPRDRDWTEEENQKFLDDTIKYKCQFLQLSRPWPKKYSDLAHAAGIKVIHFWAKRPEELKDLMVDRGIDFPMVNSVKPMMDVYRKDIVHELRAAR